MYYKCLGWFRCGFFFNLIQGNSLRGVSLWEPDCMWCNIGGSFHENSFKISTIMNFIRVTLLLELVILIKTLKPILRRRFPDSLSEHQFPLLQLRKKYSDFKEKSQGYDYDHHDRQIHPVYNDNRYKNKKVGYRQKHAEKYNERMQRGSILHIPLHMSDNLPTYKPTYDILPTHKPRFKVNSKQKLKE